MSLRGGPDAKVLVVAGGTGSGKSTICRWLAERGAFVIEADRVGHEMLLRPDVREALARRFGPDIFDSQGTVDRSALADRVFGSDEGVRALNRIVHPPLVAEIQARIDQLRRSRAAVLIVVDAALHFQFEPRIPCDAVIMTHVDVGEQERRIAARDGLDATAARARIDRQRDVLASLPRADAVLDTSKPASQTRAELLATVDRLLALRLAASDLPGPIPAAGR